MSPSLVAVQKACHIATWLTPTRFHCPHFCLFQAQVCGMHRRPHRRPVPSCDVRRNLIARQYTRKHRKIACISPHPGHPGRRRNPTGNRATGIDRFNEFENAVLENLPLIGMHSTFGCELEFVSMDTQKILADPIWNTLQECNCFNLIVRKSFTQAQHKGQLRRSAKAIQYPRTTATGCCLMLSHMYQTFVM